MTRELSPESASIDVAPTRVPVPKGLRFEVFKRDSFTCQYCGAKAPEVVLHVDHIVAVANGGTNDILNLVTSCGPCNLGKSDKALSDQSVLERTRASVAALQERREQIEMMLEWRRGLATLAQDAVEDAAAYWAERAPGWQLSDAGKKTLAKLIKRHSLDVVLEAMETAALKSIVLENGIATAESFDEAWVLVSKICNVKAADEQKPYLQRLLYIRAIVRNRVQYSFRNSAALEMLEDAHLAGATLEALEKCARRARTWAQWRDEVYALQKAAEEQAVVVPEALKTSSTLRALLTWMETMSSKDQRRVLGYAVGLGVAAEAHVYAEKNSGAASSAVRISDTDLAFGFGDALGLVRSDARERAIVHQATFSARDVRSMHSAHQSR